METQTAPYGAIGLAAPRPRVDPDGIAAACMLAVLGTAGLFYVNIMAALIDALQHSLHFSRHQAGTVAAANVLGAALGAFTASFFVRRIAWRKAAALLLTAMIVIDFASNWVTAPGALAALRLIDGLAGGFLVSTSYAVFARTRRPDRVFGFLLVVQFGLGGLATMALVRLVARYGIWLDFASLIGFSALALALLAFIPAYPNPAPDSAAARAPVPWRLCAGCFLFQAANMGLAANLIGVGMQLGLSRGAVAGVVGAATWFGIPGALIAVSLPARIGRRRPLIAGYAFGLLGLALFFLHGSSLVFTLASALLAVTWSLSVAYMLGMAAALDRSGRGAALAGFASKLGLAAGPFAAGFILDSSGGIAALLAASVLAMIGSAAMAVPVTR